MKILALDLAARTGFAFGGSFSDANCGVWSLRGFSDDDRAQSFGSLYSAVNSVIRANGIEGVAIEAPLSLGGRSAHGERVLTMLSGAAQAACGNAGVKWLKMPAPNTWRSAVYGNGYPKNPKEFAVNYCKMRGRNVAEHDAAEAMAILAWALDQFTLLDRIKT